MRLGHELVELENELHELEQMNGLTENQRQRKLEAICEIKAIEDMLNLSTYSIGKSPYTRKV